MPAYLIVIAAVDDREALLASEYPAKSAELVERFGGRYVVRAAKPELLEGDVPANASVIISEWPDATAARGFWDSGEYREVKGLREGSCRCQVLLVTDRP